MKFAYMIMAHNNLNQLCRLLKLLDDQENDIYLHIDKKSVGMDTTKIDGIVKHACIHIYRKYNVRWGGSTQVKCQMFLLSEATKTPHEYYHLISGQDLPIKSNMEIQEFFTKNKGKEFVHFESDGFCQKENCRYYNIGRGKLAAYLIAIQKKLNVQRKLYCGANWYSITSELATDFCAHKGQLIKMVRWTKCSDEYILQTFIRRVTTKKYQFYKTTLEPDDYGGTARLIDWKRGEPYVWREIDFQEIAKSDRMYARKFDERIDDKIIEMIFNKIMDGNQNAKEYEKTVE